MKKLLLFLLLIFFFIPSTKASTQTAREYILMDMNSGRILDGKDYNNPRLIASITKILTCVLAIESNKLDETITVDESILKAYGSGIYIKVGEEITLRDLLYGLMLRSGNDAAAMVSSYITGSEEEFVKLMNSKAKEIGMKHSLFRNSSGLDESDDGNYSTAYDMAILTKYAMQYDEYKKIVSTKKYSLKTNMNHYIWYNKNKLLSNSYVTGGKTGYTKKAGRTLVSSASINNLDLIVVTIRDSDDWNTHTSLYEQAAKKYKTYKIIDKNNLNINEKYYKKNLYIKNDFYIALKEDELNKIETKVKLEKIKNYQNNQKVGKYYVYLNNNLVSTIDIYVKKEEVKKNKKSFWKKVKFW